MILKLACCLALVLVCARFLPAETRASEPDRAAWAADIRQLSRVIKATHPNPFFFGVDEVTFDQNVSALLHELEGLEEAEIVARTIALVASLREGHTRITGVERVVPLTFLPIRFEAFGDGWRVTAIDRRHQAWLGARLIGIEGRRLPALLEHLRPFVEADNRYAADHRLLELIAIPPFLRATGCIDAEARIAFELETDEGTKERIELAERASPRDHDLIGLDRRRDERTLAPAEADRWFWHRVLEERRVVYARLLGFVGEPAAFATWSRALLEDVHRSEARRLVLDLRGNDGGNGRFLPSLVREIVASPVAGKRGGLVVLIDERTFSAAVSLCVELDILADPLYVGMPTGGRPNGHGNPVTMKLPRSGLTLRCSSVWVRPADPGDRRPCIWPDITAASMLEGWRNGTDTILETAIDAAAPPSLAELIAEPDAEAVESLFASLGPDSPHCLRDFERGLLELARRMIQERNAQSALRVLEIARVRYGYSSAVHAAIGAAHEALGSEVDAARAYRHALRLYGGDGEAMEGLIGMGLDWW